MLDTSRAIRDEIMSRPESERLSGEYSTAIDRTDSGEYFFRRLDYEACVGMCRTTPPRVLPRTEALVHSHPRNTPPSFPQDFDVTNRAGVLGVLIDATNGAIRYFQGSRYWTVDGPPLPGEPR